MAEQLKRAGKGRVKLHPPPTKDPGVATKPPNKNSTVPTATTKTSTKDPGATTSTKDSEVVKTAPLPENKMKADSSDSGTGFGGLRKGFLFGSTPASAKDKRVSTKVQGSVSTDVGLDPSCQATVKKVDADDMIRPKQQGSKSSSLEFPEVQEAMKESFPFLNTKDWMTDNLLEKVEKDPVLSRAFQDPAMAQALAQFQANPQLAFAAAKDKPEMQKFLQSFCALMGEHFTELDETQEKTRAPVSEIVPHEEAQMKEILSKPEVSRVLEDPLIRKLIETLKTNPMAAQRLLHSSNPDLKLKIRVLIDHGLLAMQ